MADKRITELTNERLILGDGDFTIVDSNEGTYKYKLKRIMDAIPAIDDSLSHEGQSADAKAVGDALANVDVDTVNNARQLLSEKYLLDEEPYLFRASGGEGSDRVEECSIVGGSVAWNQLVYNGDFENTNGWLTSGTGGSFTVSNNIANVVCTNAWSGLSANSAHFWSVRNNHKYLYSAWIKKNNADDRIALYYGTAFGGTTEIANTTNWQHIEVIKSAVADSNGTNRPYFDNQNANVSYQLKNVQFFDLTTLFGSTIADYIYSLEQATAGAGVAWFRKYFPEDYYPYSAPTLRHVEGVSAKQIRDSDDNVTAIYPLDSTLTLRGIPQLVDGKLKWDGDIYPPNGLISRRYNIVDLGALTWSYAAENGYFYSSIGGKMAGNYNFICSKYPTTTSTSVSEMSDKQIKGHAVNNTIHIKDSNYSTGAELKSALSGAMCVYELATPTTESADPYTEIQNVSNCGTEEFVTTGIVPVGHYSKYLENLRSKIEGLPRDFSTLIAPTEKEYKATRNYTVGSLLIVDNILYKVTSAIANGGAITPNTNVTATTLAAVIAAL